MTKWKVCNIDYPTLWFLFLMTFLCNPDRCHALLNVNAVNLIGTSHLRALTQRGLGSVRFLRDNVIHEYISTTLYWDHISMIKWLMLKCYQTAFINLKASANQWTVCVTTCSVFSSGSLHPLVATNSTKILFRL